eukprot:TRINITY_DN15724_c0_g1_i1.p1 TRINITY_DN15724_c0_g1~~TRINITY_DN15724_c0_g1_i1.p1  ORF type:complete len:554 (-),score=80.02 TRINITY_DN15724_c0_g1_i1:75-1736(-)
MGDKKELKGEEAVQLIKSPSVSVLQSLEVLNLQGTGISIVPDSALEHCKNLIRLDIGGNPLKGGLPSAVADLPKMEILFASKVGLQELPSSLARCPRLRMLGIKDNALTSIDGAHLPACLEWLIAAGNQITELPNIGRLKHVRKLMLSHNQLTRRTLAPVAKIEALEMLRVAANRLEGFPKKLLEHPRLAWVACGSNPFTDKALESQLKNAPSPVNFADVKVSEEKLGSGAGATVYKGEFDGREVAVKLWESTQFSDGTAFGEWAANRVAAEKPCSALVSMLGAFEEPKMGLILELLTGYKAAAGPPSFASVTRDHLPSHSPPGPGPRFTAAAALKIAQSVAKGAAGMHACGLMHGDIYLHNTLVKCHGPETACDVADARLSDFGGASVIEDARLRRLDVRSFGWLLQDLLESIPDGGEAKQEAEEVELLRRCREACARSSVKDLPTFEEVLDILSGIVVMKVTAKKGSAFFMRSASIFFRGSEDKQPVKLLKLSGLGEAINVVASVATQCEARGLAKIVNMETSEVAGALDGYARRTSAQFNVLLRNTTSSA